MKQKRAQKILEKVKTSSLTKEEKLILESWYLDLNVDHHSDLSESELAKDFEIMRSSIPHLQPKHNRIKFLPRMAAAASILLFLAAGAYFAFHTTAIKRGLVSQKLKNDVLPGINSATLTLGNGKTIVLNSRANGRIAVQGATTVIKSKDGQILYEDGTGENDSVMENLITTRRKEQYSVILADETKVWLNAGSSIKYPTIFKGKNREVTVSGELYFEVAHNASKPFRVLVNNQIIEVLGTHFNINAYSDEPGIKTTLLEGSVRVSANNNIKLLKPGQQAVFQNDELTVSEADTEEATAWKNGYFRFKNEDIKSIMRKLSRWYDIDVEFGKEITAEEFSGKVSRFRNISQVLNMLELSKSVHFKIEGRRVTVLK